MDEFARQVPTIEGLDSQSDDDLRSVIDQARNVLGQRKMAREKEAVSEIRRIAKENGLDVAVGKSARKRGRPRKKVDAA